MTTILTNGHFLIADKRSTVSERAVNKIRLGHVDKHHSDSSIKIVLPVGLHHINTNKSVSVVKALALAGSTTKTAANLMLTAERFKNLNEYISCLHSGAIDRSGNNVMVCILDNGAMVEIRNHNNVTKAIQYEAGTLLAHGTGARSVSNPFVNDLYKAKKVSLLELFHYCCLQDNSSNVDTYSAYSLEEDHLFGNVQSVPSQVYNGFQLVSQGIHAASMARMESTFKTLPPETQATSETTQ